MFKNPFCGWPGWPQENHLCQLRLYQTPEEILEIAQDAYQNTQEKIRDLARNLESKKTRHRINYKKLPSITSPNALMQLYVKEVQALRRFFYSQDVITFPAGEKVILLETPSYHYLIITNFL